MLRQTLGGQGGFLSPYVAALTTLAILGLALASLCGCAGRKDSSSASLVSKKALTLAAEGSANDRVADADAEPVTPPPSPAPPQAPEAVPAVTLTLESTDLLPGAKLYGKIIGRWGDDVVHMLWIDGVGRVVADFSAASPPKGEPDETPFSLQQPACCLGQQHQLMLVRASKEELRKAERDKTTPPFRSIAQASFRVLDAARPENDYLVLLGDGCENADPAFWRALAQSGVRGGCVVALDPATELVRRGMPFISNAMLHDANPLRPSGKWAERMQAYAKSRDAALLQRHPAIFDDRALASVQTAIEKSCAAKSGPPLAWSLGDRLSLTNGASPFDYDMSPGTLEVFRVWLQDHYGSLLALNRQWGTEFATWDSVRPPTTDSTKAALNPLYAAGMKVLLEPPAPPPPVAAPAAPAAPVEPGAIPPPPPLPLDIKAPPAPDDKAAAPAPAPPPAPVVKIEDRDGVRGFALAHGQLRAPGGENLSAWCDWREFNSFAFARLLREYRAALRQHGGSDAGMLDAEPPSAWGGWDYTALARSVDWIEEHSSSPLGRDMLRSFAPATRFYSGFAAAQEADIGRLWDRWLRGDAGCILQHHPQWAKPPEYQPAPEAKAFVAELRRLTDGLSLVRSLAHPASDAVAIYYSPRSFQVHWMLDSEADGSFWLRRDRAYEATHSSALPQLNAWQALLEDLGYAPRFLSPRQLLAGELIAKTSDGKPGLTGVKVVVLPKVIAMNDDEVDALRRFTRAGGIVIADGACGLFDGHGKRRPPQFLAATGRHGIDASSIGALDRDFGIVRRDLRVLESNGISSDDDSARVTMKSQAAPGATAAAGPESSELRVLEPGVRASGARQYGMSRAGAAALLSMPAGRGRFIYLNLGMQDYPSLRKDKEPDDFRFPGMRDEEYEQAYGAPTGGEALRLVVGDILGEVLPENPLRVRSLDGTPLRSIRRARFNLGKDAWLFGVTPAVAIRKTEAWTGLQTPHHWYDVRNGAYLGSNTMVKVALEPNRPALLAALPYHVERLGLKIRRTDARGSFKIGISVGVREECELGTHVFHIEVAGPDGQPLPYYTRNVAAAKGRCDIQVSLGLNEPSGMYQMTVRDVLTGETASAGLQKDIAEYTSASTVVK